MPPNQIDPSVAVKPPINIMTNGDITENLSKVQLFYKNAKIFITGGTGFLGKILIEKLLRSCPDIDSIYILIRSKKDKNIHSRIADIFDDPIFERLHTEQPKFQHKIQTISGDCALPNLGMSDSDIELLQRECSIVFHVAATVRFDENIRLATSINILAPKDLVEISRGMKQLKSFIHVSTAFANCPQKFIGEKFYKPPIEAEKLIKLLDAVEDKVMDRILPTILGKWPNTYAFTKAVAENVFRQNGTSLPIGVFRPAIVISTYKEPIKGWIDNMYGPTGVSAAAANGVMRTLHCDKEAVAEIVPVDTCVNALIVAAYDTSNRHTALLNEKKIKTEDDIPIYNYVSSVEQPITWERFMDLTYSFGISYPSINALYYYNLTLNKYWPIHWLYLIFLHYIPALLLDVGCVLIAKPPKLMKLYGKIHTFMKVISYFSTRSWTFTNNNVQSLWTNIDKKDQDLFFFDMKQLYWEEFFQCYMMGIRLYLIKDPISTLNAALKRWKRLYYIHQVVRIVAGLLLLRLVWFMYSSIF